MKICEDENTSYQGEVDEIKGHRMQYGTVLGAGNNYYKRQATL
jgi:hypothetical protein